LLLPLLFFSGPLSAADAPPAPATAEEAAFEMTEFSVFDEPEGSDLLRGQAAYCQKEPYEQVKKYPELRSKRPWYGEIVFGRDLGDSSSGKTYYFVLDESGEQPKPKSDQEAESWMGKLADTLSGKAEKEETEKAESAPATYDRLYFDLNGDLDLTNDPPLGPHQDPPAKAIPSWFGKQTLAFSELNIPIGVSPSDAPQPFPILPRLTMGESQGKPYASLFFLALTARRGTVQIASQEHTAVLSQPYLITGRFDIPTIDLKLDPSVDPGNWWEGKMVAAMHWVDGRFYAFRASPTGDQLFVKPYQGEFGTFRIGPGNRDLDKCTMQGSLRSSAACVVVGKYSEEKVEQTEIEECRLPVGDYLPSWLTLNYGHLRISLSDNYHLDGKLRAMLTKSSVYGIKIRKDEPFVLDFSNKPEVLFASPGKDKTFHPGDEIEIKAVLVDPVLDLMIRRLDDTSRKEKKTAKQGNEETSYERDVSLDPTVTVTDSSGKTIAEGILPFG
jgi:hypothetical protein